MKAKKAPGKSGARRPALLPALLGALDARPDVTVLTRTWPVLFVQLRYVLEKTVVNADGFSPLHRETPLFYGQAWQAERGKAGWTLEPVPKHATVIGEYAAYVVLNPSESVAPVEPDQGVRDSLGPIHSEVAARLGLAAPVERTPAITGRAMER